MEHLALEIFNRDGNGGKYAFLPSNTSITIIDTSEIFDSGDIWSYSFKLNIPANAHIFGSAGEMHGSRLHEQINKRRARLWVEGLPLYYGYLRLDDEVDVDEDGDVNVSFESGQKTFHDMIEGAKANQVPIPDDILIGMALVRERTLHLTANILVNGYNAEGRAELGGFQQVTLTGPTGFAQEFPKHVRPDGTWEKNGTGERIVISASTTINKDQPYDAGHPYCNTRIGYQKYVFEAKNDSLEKVASMKYKTCEPRRINPAPNFYVLYWLNALMKHLGIYIEENQMTNIEDMRRLFFVNTKCAYESRGDDYIGPYPDDAPAYRSLQFSPTVKNFVPFMSDDNKSWEFSAKQVNEHWQTYTWGAEMNYLGWDGTDDTIKWKMAYATSDNFPDVDINDVIEAIENGFGVKFMFNRDYTKVRMVLLRNVLRSQEVYDVLCEITEVSKQENSIRGFRLTYGGSKDDTNYFYRGFVQAKVAADGGWITEEDLHDYSQWDMNLHYDKIKGEVGMLNRTCYIDMKTGNAYIVKIDENFKSMEDDANESLFECAPFMDAEDGDCTGDEETIKEISIGFSPMIVNAVEDGGYALFVSEEMGVSSEEIGIGIDTKPIEMPPLLSGSIRGDQKYGCTESVQTRAAQSGLFEIATRTMFNPVTVRISNSNYSAHADVEVSGSIREGYRIYLQDNYKPGEDLECPLEKHDWGLMLGIMRGSGSDSSLKYSEDIDDNEGNDTWQLMSGSGAYAHSDTCDDNGGVWDYDGTIGYNAVCGTPEEAIEAMRAIWGPKAHNFSLTTRNADNYLTAFILPTVEDNLGKSHVLLLAAALKNQSPMMWTELRQQYIAQLQGKSVEQMVALDAENANVLIEVDSSREKGQTLLALQKLAYGDGDPVTISDGVDVREGRFSLKLRAEKPNPFYDPTQPESAENQRFLKISNPNLRQRGLADQFYKEYSYWVRNARIAKMKVKMELAQFLNIDKTKRVRIGDITGFIKKMQYSIDMSSGLGLVNMEVWYL